MLFRSILQSGAYLASDPSIELETRWGGARTFFSREGLFLIRASGRGPLFFSSYGAIVEVPVPSSGYVVDTGHLVAFDPGLQWEVTKVGGISLPPFISAAAADATCIGVTEIPWPKAMVMVASSPSVLE